jgi:hypothetical protein
MNNPKISILLPTYNRNKFKKLVEYNLQNIDYNKNKLDILIFDDGNEKFFKDKNELDDFKKNIKPIKLNYIYDNTRHYTIGEKRNKLVKMSNNKYFINMDDDEIYLPSYITNSIQLLLKKKCGLVGAADSLLLYPKYNYNMAYVHNTLKNQILESTMCYTKKHFNRMGGFKKVNLYEGSNMINYNENNVELTKADECLVSIAHDDNIFNKYKLYSNKISIRFNNKDCINLLKDILKYNYDEKLNKKESDNIIIIEKCKNTINKILNNMNILKNENHQNIYNNILKYINEYNNSLLDNKIEYDFKLMSTLIKSEPKNEKIISKKKYIRKKRLVK